MTAERLRLLGEVVVGEHGRVIEARAGAARTEILHAHAATRELATQIEVLYPGIEQQNHKYVEGGHYLRAGADSGEGVVVFETGADDVVTEWRVGLPPQVDYVEGCS